MALFLSTIVNKVDRKGRVSVPAPFRSALAGQSFNGIVAFRSFKLDAIECRDMATMEEMAARLDTLEQFSEDYDSLATLFADSQQLGFDGEGRIMLSQDLIAHAGIGESAAFVGLGSTFQIWEPVAFERHKQAQRERARRTGMTLPPRRAGLGSGPAASGTTGGSPAVTP
ncbi:MAG TPA: division/cell wall cluster transcriptional repressor MraZ [Stellaceae bacterium]|nr:division/cell wall cluster transcriptional repressor MraZ [Stellaceae bacterium]